MLTNDSQKAQWQNEGLPADRISIENGAIITNCNRWPLIIDPQLQGISWIRSHEEARLKVQQAQLAEKLAARNPGTPARKTNPWPRVIVSCSSN